ncbi:MAG: hypothetical protein MUE51_13545 [Thermoleophilia bacterium]|jgi:hypothetical protein|nr:hypothetical protein [Thermoleophilia bacterium]
MEPRTYAWVVPGRLAVAERPGGGGRTHRRERREAEQDWWRGQGVWAVVSGMRSRHGLTEYAADGLAVRWHPLRDPEQARAELPRLVDAVLDLLARGDGAVLVHCDHPNEWLAAVDAALRLRLGLAGDIERALIQAAGDGLPIGDLAIALVGAERPAPGAAAALAA